MILAVEFMVLSVQIHPRQGYCGGDVSPPILRGFRHSHLGYGGLVGPDDVPSLKYRHRFWKSRHLEVSNEI